MLTFACLAPHAPIFLPEIGSPEDRNQVKATIKSLESLAPRLANPPAGGEPEIVIISSPHQDWGIKVPAHFLLGEIRNSKLEIRNYQTPDSFVEEIRNSKFENRNFSLFPIITTLDSPEQHYLWGRQIAAKLPKDKKLAWIASGDMSHVLKEDGPYGFNPAGPEFDRKFIELLKKKDIEGILNLDLGLVERAAVCGLWSFCLLLGALEELNIKWTPEVLSYEGPFGVGYLVANIRINANGK